MTEKKILASAKKEFMRLGFHASTLQQIAEDAGVNRTSIHYYFRSKEKLYGEIIKEIVPMLPGLKFPPDERFSYLWFILMEIQTNRPHFVNTLTQNGFSDWNREIEKSVIQEFKSLDIVQF
jgi:AcrR family transcriptional regulator